MKKYKLIQTYPGSPKLGTTAERFGSDSIKYTDGSIVSSATLNYFDKIITNNPEFWEEVVEKDYEILSFKRNGNFMSIEQKKLATLQKDGSYLHIKLLSTIGGATLEFMLKNSFYNIHSVKRLSDGEIFTVGGKVNSYIIDTICLSEKGIKIFFQDERLKPYLLKDIILRKPLFTTEDGVDIYQGDKYYELALTFEPSFRHAIYQAEGRPNIIYDYSIPEKRKEKNKHGRYYFSTKEAAEEYILINKVCLSLNDVLSYLNTLDDFGYDLDDYPKLKNLVKKKIKNGNKLKS